MNKKSTAQWTAFYGMLIALAIVLGYVETLIPISIGIPGAKLGLANLVTIVGLYTVGIGGTVIVSLLRIIVVGFTFGNVTSMFISLGGWLVSIIIMVFFKKMGWFGTVGISILGGIGHNIGQIFVASIVLKQIGLFYYLPLLLIAGTVAGLVIGIIGGMLVNRVNQFIKK